MSHIDNTTFDHLWFEWDQLTSAADILADSDFGEFCDAVILGHWAAQCGGCGMQERGPDVAALSVMFAGQVLPAMAMARRVRRRWPAARLAWGGAHVTALRGPIAAGPRAYRRRLPADVMVAGYAEKTLVELLDGIRAGISPRGILVTGVGSTDAAPLFTGLEAYGVPRLTLPAQVCAFIVLPSARH